MRVLGHRRTQDVDQPPFKASAPAFSAPAMSCTAAASLLRRCAAGGAGSGPHCVQGAARGMATNVFGHLGKTVGQPISPSQARTSE